MRDARIVQVWRACCLNLRCHRGPQYLRSRAFQTEWRGLFECAPSPARLRRLRGRVRSPVACRSRATAPLPTSQYPRGMRDHHQRPLLTSALRSECLAAFSVVETTQSRSPGVSSVAFRAQSPGLRFASLMDMDFAVGGPLVRRLRLVPGSCPSTRTFALRFLQTSPRGDSPCVVANPSPPSGWVEDSHLQATEHAQHTSSPLRGSKSREARNRSREDSDSAVAKLVT